MAKPSVNKKELSRIAKRIRQLRKDKGMSQYQLSIKSDMSINYIGMLERELYAPSLDILISICKVLDISLEEFFEGM